MNRSGCPVKGTRSCYSVSYNPDPKETNSVRYKPHTRSGS